MPAAKTPKPKVSKTEAVDAYMATLNHPLKAEAQALREIIKGVHKDITEEVKWNAPSFSYKGYLVTFNLRPTDHVHLIFHNGALLDDQGGWLEGDYVDRRMVYFRTMDEVVAKKPKLVKAIKQWIKLMDQGVSPTAEP